jgi:hypothetical protein
MARLKVERSGVPFLGPSIPRDVHWWRARLAAGIDPADLSVLQLSPESSSLHLVVSARARSRADFPLTGTVYVKGGTTRTSQLQERFHNQEDANNAARAALELGIGWRRATASRTGTSVG